MSPIVAWASMSWAQVEQTPQVRAGTEDVSGNYRPDQYDPEARSSLGDRRFNPGRMATEVFPGIRQINPKRSTLGERRASLGNSAFPWAEKRYVTSDAKIAGKISSLRSRWASLGNRRQIGSRILSMERNVIFARAPISRATDQRSRFSEQPYLGEELVKQYDGRTQQELEKIRGFLREEVERDGQGRVILSQEQVRALLNRN